MQLGGVFGGFAFSIVKALWDMTCLKVGDAFAQALQTQPYHFEIHSLQEIYVVSFVRSCELIFPHELLQNANMKHTNQCFPLFHYIYHRVSLCQYHSEIMC